MVAEDDEKPITPEERKRLRLLEVVGGASVRDEVEVGEGIDPLESLPGGLDPSLWKTIEDAINGAFSEVGQGSGPAYGTAVHTEVRDAIRALNNSLISTEQSFLNGDKVLYGTKDSIRLDILIGRPGAYSAILDLKTGNARLSTKRAADILTHFPADNKPRIFEVKP